MDASPQLPPALKRYAQAAHAGGSRLTESALKPGRSSSRLDDLVRRLHKEFDGMVQQAFASLPGDGPACTAGCDHCCRTLRITVSPVEIFTISHRLRQTQGADADLDERLARFIAEYSQSASPAGTAARAADRPCPLLHQGLCVVYSSRPLACRGCVSADAALCAACDDERPVPRSTLHQLGAAAMLQGITDALDRLGLAGHPTELRDGLAPALNDDQVEKRWLRGEDVFPGYRPH